MILWISAVGAAAVSAMLLIETVLARRDARRYPPPGRLFDVGGHRLHAVVHGEGEPLVVLESGAGSWSTHWAELTGRIARFTRVVSYDRGGLGWSDLAPRPRTCDVLARELDRLLHAMGVAGSVVLVAHSFGGMVARAFVAQSQLPVAGVVLIDAYPETFTGRIAEAGLKIPDATAGRLRVAAILGRLGLLRLLGWMASKLGRPEPELGFAAETFETLAAVGSRRRVIEGLAREMEDGDRSDLVAAALPRRMDLPLRVLTATETLGPAEGLPAGFDRDAYNRLWREENARFLELSADARQIMVEGDHLIPLGQPDLVENVVRELVTEARARARGGSGEAPERS